MSSQQKDYKLRLGPISTLYIAWAITLAFVCLSSLFSGQFPRCYPRLRLAVFAGAPAAPRKTGKTEKLYKFGARAGLSFSRRVSHTTLRAVSIESSGRKTESPPHQKDGRKERKRECVSTHTPSSRQIIISVRRFVPVNIRSIDCAPLPLSAGENMCALSHRDRER